LSQGNSSYLLLQLSSCILILLVRAARLAGESLKDLEEINEIQESNPSSLGEKLKKIALGLLGRLGFFGILLFASVPNPLFDLAGITCGHFLVPFWTFFGATAIGKAVVKVHFQTIFIILVFSVEHLTALVDFVESSFPFLKVFKSTHVFNLSLPTFVREE